LELGIMLVDAELVERGVLRFLQGATGGFDPLHLSALPLPPRGSRAAASGAVPGRRRPAAPAARSRAGAGAAARVTTAVTGLATRSLATRTLATRALAAVDVPGDRFDLVDLLGHECLDLRVVAVHSGLLSNTAYIGHGVVQDHAGGELDADEPEEQGQVLHDL